MSETRRRHRNTPAAEKKIEEALVLMERAQNTLGDACAKVSSVRGLVREWERLCRTYDQIKAQWHHLNNLVGPELKNGLSLDSEDVPVESTSK